MTVTPEKVITGQKCQSRTVRYPVHTNYSLSKELKISSGLQFRYRTVQVYIFFKKRPGLRIEATTVTVSYCTVEVLVPIVLFSIILFHTLVVTFVPVPSSTDTLTRVLVPIPT